MQNAYISSDIAVRIKAAAKMKGVTVISILSECGLSKNTIMNFKTSMPKADNLAKIADSLGCSVDYLLGRTDNPNICTDAYIGGDNNGVQAVKNGAVTIHQVPENGNILRDEIDAALTKLPRSEQLRATADILDLLEQKYATND